MSEQVTINQDDKALAAVAHASILLGIMTSGIGGIIAALVIYLVQKEKSAYVAFQSLQALVYQGVAMILTMVAWCCWGALWMLMIFPPLFANPDAYYYGPPPGLWVGMFFMIIPFAVWGFTILYGLWAAVRCLGGHDFRYAIVANWLDS
jgi:uncharacterized Tic20 family protein